MERQTGYWPLRRVWGIGHKVESGQALPRTCAKKPSFDFQGENLRSAPTGGVLPRAECSHGHSAPVIARMMLPEC